MQMTSFRLVGLLVAGLIALFPSRANTTTAAADSERPRMMQVGKNGDRAELPLVSGHLSCEVRGPIAQVVLVQSFHNPSDEPIEAIYVFPLPERSAVGGMTMRLGNRTIRAVIKARDDARATYDQAKAAGKAATLLEQERPNVFTQSVANILPGEQIDVELTYDILLEPDDGEYEIALPTVVGPRYIPGDALLGPQSGGGRSPDTDQVPAASRISPPVARPGESTDATFGLDLELDAGLPITEISSPTHDIVVAPRPGDRHRVTLADGLTAADKDLVVRWKVVVQSPELAVLADRSGERGHLALVLQPPATPQVATGPREMVFVVDTSGSMEGEPLALVKRAMRRALGELAPGDAFRIINFFTDVGRFRDGEVVSVSDKNIRDARSWINGLTSGGGTEMIQGIRAALPGPPADQRTRYVVFMTDGYIGNEMEILEAIAALRDDRTYLFSFGVGSSVNRYLLDEMARVGEGVVSYMLLDEDPVIQIDRFFDRVASPAMTNIAIDWGGLPIEEASPAASAIESLFVGRPIVIAARYLQGAKGTIKVTGVRGNERITLVVPVDLPDATGDGAVLGRLWARRRIAELSAPGRTDATADERDITRLALAYSLMSPYTSFVAVEDHRRVLTPGREVQVPVDLPEGVSESAVGAFGEVITISGTAPIIDQSSTRTGMTITQDYTQNIPFPGRTFVAVLGSASGSVSLENQYHVDGINTSGLEFGSAGVLGRWRLSLDAKVGFDLRGEQAVGGISPSIERLLGNHLAVGLTGTLWRLDDRSLASALATIARWSILRLFDLRLGLGLAFAADDIGPAWQIRLAAPLPLGRSFHPELSLGLDSVMPGEDQILGGTLGIGVRF